MSDHIWDFVRHEKILVGQCLMTDSYLQPCLLMHFLWFNDVFRVKTVKLANNQISILFYVGISEYRGYSILGPKG